MNVDSFEGEYMVVQGLMEISKKEYEKSEMIKKGLEDQREKQKQNMSMKGREVWTETPPVCQITLY
jgi:hypothetical protein